jgi:hypothetical protein
MPSSIRLCLAGLMSALALAACTTAGATPGDGTTASAGLNVATPTEASAGVKPPAAPTGLHEWVDESSDPVPAHFAWTPPSGPIGGYYFWKKGVYVGMTPPPAICGPSWEKLPATATTYTINSVEAQPDAYICAFNAAGTSPTVHFTQDTPLASTPTKAKAPAAPGGLFAQLTMTRPGSEKLRDDFAYLVPRDMEIGVQPRRQVLAEPRPSSVRDDLKQRLSEMGRPIRGFQNAVRKDLGLHPLAEFDGPASTTKPGQGE